MVLLAAWCSLRFGEASVLHWGDLDLDKAVWVRRAQEQASGFQADETEAWLRTVTIRCTTSCRTCGPTAGVR